MTNYSFDISHAQDFGDREAIFIFNLAFWINHNRANKKNFHDGKTWTYNSHAAFIEIFPFWTSKQIRRVIESLLEQGVIIKGNYNKSSYDQTLWYAFADESKFLLNLGDRCPKGQMVLPEKSNENAQKGKPIPDINPIYKEELLLTLEEFTALGSEKEVVVSSEKKEKATSLHLEVLNISESTKKSITAKYTDAQIKLAVERCLKWTYRNSDEQGIWTALHKEKEWNDNPASNQFEEKNKKFLESLMHLDGKEIGNTLITIGHKYIEFVCGLKNNTYQVDQSDFINLVKKYILYLQGIQKNA